MEEFITHSADETQQLGISLAAQSKKGGIIALYGDLGSGKTTFMQGFARGLGIKKRIISPTFVLIREYKESTVPFYHIDLYRLEGEQAIESTGIRDILQNQPVIVAIEWADKMKSLLPEKRLEIYFQYLSDTTRQIQLKNYG